jgi:hypothetical protein
LKEVALTVNGGERSRSRSSRVSYFLGASGGGGGGDSRWGTPRLEGRWWMCVGGVGGFWVGKFQEVDKGEAAEAEGKECVERERTAQTQLLNSSSSSFSSLSPHIRPDWTAPNFSLVSSRLLFGRCPLSVPFARPPLFRARSHTHTQTLNSAYFLFFSFCRPNFLTCPVDLS